MSNATIDLSYDSLVDNRLEIINGTFFTVKTTRTILDEKGKEKKNKNQYIVRGDTVNEIERTMMSYFSKINDFDSTIDSISLISIQTIIK